MYNTSKSSKIHETAILYDGVIINENCVIEAGCIIYPNVVIGSHSHIGPYTIIGEPDKDYYEQEQHNFKRTIIGKDAIIRSNSVIYENVSIGEQFRTGHRITIRENTFIGNGCSVGTLCDIQGNVNVGNFVRMHSNVHIGQLSTICDYVWLFPYVVLTNDLYPPFAKLQGVFIDEYAIIATSSVIMPGVKIGKNSIIGASSLVRKDVPDEMLVVGSPAKPLYSVREIKDKSGMALYPWKEYLPDNRGYPWQK